MAASSQAFEEASARTQGCWLVRSRVADASVGFLKKYAYVNDPLKDLRDREKSVEQYFDRDSSF